MSRQRWLRRCATGAVAASPRPRWRSLLLSLLVVLPLQLSAQQPTDLQDRAAELLARESCQSALPNPPGGAGAPLDPKEPPPSAAQDRPADRAPPPIGWNLGGWLGGGVDFARLLFWVFVTVALSGLVALVVRALRDRTEPLRKRVQPVRSSRVPHLPTASAPPPDHELLAASGQFAPAIHALLLGALQRLADRCGGLEQSTTGREALRVAARIPQGLGALRELVQRVERSRFGGSVVDVTDYQASRVAFEDWSTACDRPT